MRSPKRARKELDREHPLIDDTYAALGIWRPDADSLRKIREAIVEDPSAWKRARNAKSFRETWTMGGDALKRAPKGFDPEHPLIEDLRRKDFIASRKLTKKAVMSADLPAELAALFKRGAPFQRRICGVLGLQY